MQQCQCRTPINFFRHCRLASIVYLNTRRLEMQARLFAALWAAFWMVTTYNTSATVNFWTCPNLHGPDEVSCTCELAHALQCRGTYSEEGFQKIVSLLRSLPANNTVQVLDLQLHNFTSIPEHSFRDINLHAMIISSMDSLSLLPDSFRGLEGSLVALGLPSNDLREIPTSALQILTLIEKIDFSNNLLTSLTADDLTPFRNLEELNLSNNNITTIDDYVFKNNRKLRKLILDGNKLSDPLFSWSKTIYNGLPLLENLSLVRTDQVEGLMKQTLPKLPGLTRLNLSFNNLTSVQFRAFIDLPKLQFLDISYNQLAFLDKEAFQGLHNLLKLDLSHNRLTELYQESFIGLTSLDSLTINDNYLNAISHSAFSELQAIRSINLRDNEISFINPMAFSHAKSLESLELQDNNLPCSCRMKAFAMWLKSSTMTMTSKRQIQCETPSGSSRVLVDMKYHEFACSNETPAESLAKIKEEESGHFSSISSIRLQLIEYDYKLEEKTLVLVWDVDSQAQPYECDAVFIFEKIDRLDEIRRKVPIICHSDVEVDPRQLTMRLNSIDLREANVYRFCIVLFTITKSLIPGCSELLQLSGSQLTSFATAEQSSRETATRVLLKENGENAFVSSGFPSIHVNLTPSQPESLTVWWKFPPEFMISDLCVLNVSLLTANRHVAADRVIQCSKSTVNFSDVNPSESYKVCISILDPTDSYQEHNCVSIGASPYHMAPVASNPVITTVLTSVFVGLAGILLIAVFLTARRMFWPSKKSIGLISTNPQYRVLYHQPEDPTNPLTTSDVAQLTREV